MELLQPEDNSSDDLNPFQKSDEEDFRDEDSQPQN